MEEEEWSEELEECRMYKERIECEGLIDSVEKDLEEIEAEEIEHEGTVEDAKVRKVTRHDTP